MTIDSIRQNGFSTEKQIALLHALEEQLSKDFEDSLALAFTHYYLGNRYNTISQFTSSTHHSRLASDLFKALKFKGYQRAYAISKLGDAYHNNGKFNKALDTYLQLDKLDLKGREYNALANGSRMSAMIYRNRSDNESAIRILEHTQQFKDSIFHQDYTKLILELAINYLNSNQLDKAQQSLLESKLHNQSQDVLTQIFQEELEANIKLKAKEYGEAIKIYDKTLKTIDNNEFPENVKEQVSTILSNNSFNLRIAGQPKKALEMSLRAIKTFNNSTNPNFTNNKIVMLDNLSMAFLELAEIDSARYYNTIAIKSIREYEEFSTSFRKTLIELIINKSKINYSQYLVTNDKIYLRNSLADLLEMDRLFDAFIEENVFEQSSINVKAEFLNTFRNAVDIAYEAQDLEAFWIFSEKTKGIILLDAVNRNLQIDESSNTLIRTLASEEIKLTLLLNEDHVNLTNRDSISRRLTQLRKEQFDIKTQQFKHNRNLSIKYISIQTIQKNLGSDVILNYQYGNEDVYGIKILEDKFLILKLCKITYLDSLIQKHIKLIHQTSFNSEKFDEFFNSAHNLFNSLIAPFNTNNESLIIIPNDKLNYIPFESLITKPGDTFYPNYLLLQHPIQYAISGNIYFHLKRNQTASTSVNVLNPDYKSINNENKGTGILPLTYAKEEIESIRQFIKTNPIKDKAAFFDAIQSTNILHFSGHAILDTLNNNWSFLALSSNTKPEDKITLAELYNQRSNSSLVVLSACETGSGNIIKGEGVSSITRGLLYSGTQAVLNTLWSVNDQSTSTIISSFYKYLKEGDRKSQALRKAKLSYLKEAPDELKHPYYWSSIISVGNDSPLNLKQDFNWRFILTGFGIFILVLFTTRWYGKVRQ